METATAMGMAITRTKHEIDSGHDSDMADDNLFSLKESLRGDGREVAECRPYGAGFRGCTRNEKNIVMA